MRFRKIFLYFIIFSNIIYSTNAKQDNNEQIIIKSFNDYKNTPFKQYNIPSGTKLTIKKNDNNEKTYHLKFSGGVIMTSNENNDSITAVDISNYGAIGCMNMLNISTKFLLEKCYPEEKD